MLPLGLSSYVLGAAIWLVTDNAALLFVVLALGGCLSWPATLGRIGRWSLYAAAAVLVRQLHLWVAVPVGLVAALAEGRWRPVTLPLVLLPFVALLPFLVMWRGLTPPSFVAQYAGINVAAWPMSLALLGSFGLFYLPAFATCRQQLVPRSAWVWVAVVAAIVLSLVMPTDYDREAGRWGGAVWELVRRMPVVADRSLVLAPLAGLGVYVVAVAAGAARLAGRRREATVLLLSLAGWLLAQTASGLAFQRYCEPVVLLLLTWLVMLARAGPPTGVRRRWWAGPVLLGVIQLALCGHTLFQAVWKSGSWA